MCSIGKTLLALFLTLYSKAKLACYSRYLLTSYFCIPVPYCEKDIFLLGVSSSRSFFIELFNFSFFDLSGWGKDLDYCDIEWFALETEIILSFLRLYPSTASCTFVHYEG